MTATTTAPTLPDTDVNPALTGPGEPLLAHYVDKAASTEALVYGTEVQALCGKRWVPTRDPKRYPVCNVCQDLYDQAPDTTPRNDT